MSRPLSRTAHESLLSICGWWWYLLFFLCFDQNRYVIVNCPEWMKSVFNSTLCNLFICLFHRVHVCIVQTATAFNWNFVTVIYIPRSLAAYLKPNRLSLDHLLKLDITQIIRQGCNASNPSMLYRQVYYVYYGVRNNPPYLYEMFWLAADSPIIGRKTDWLSSQSYLMDHLIRYAPISRGSHPNIARPRKSKKDPDQLRQTSLAIVRELKGLRRAFRRSSQTANHPL